MKIGRMRLNLLYGRAIDQIDQPINQNEADVASLDREWPKPPSEVLLKDISVGCK